MKVVKGLMKARVLLFAIPLLVFFCDPGWPFCIGQNDGPGGKIDFGLGNGCPTFSSTMVPTADIG